MGSEMCIRDRRSPDHAPGVAWRNWRGILTLMGRGPALPGPSLANALADGGIAALGPHLPGLLFPGYQGPIQGLRRLHLGAASPPRFRFPTFPEAQLPSPVQPGRGLQRFQGRQRRFKYPIHQSLVSAILRYPAPSWAKLRNCLAVAPVSYTHLTLPTKA